MSLGRPEFLWLLLPLAFVAAAYVAAVGRLRGAATVRFGTEPLMGAARRAGWMRQHLAALLLGFALVMAIASGAKPLIPWRTPAGVPVVLIIDISRSMEENDIRPSRIEAAKAAAHDFVRGTPARSPAALVTFGNYATTVVPLTLERDRLHQAITALSTQLRTQLGTGLIEGLRALRNEGTASLQPPSAQTPPTGALRGVAILLSDGRASDGVPPLEAAAEAQRLGVRVYTVGVGTAADPSTFRSGYWGVLDEPTLVAIASMTGGEYYHANSAERLRSVYRNLAKKVSWERSMIDGSALAAAAAFILLAASLTARSWTSSIP